MKHTIGLLIFFVLGTAPALLAQTKWSGPFTLKVTIEGAQDSVGITYYDMVHKKLVTERKVLQQGMVLFEGQIDEPTMATVYIGPASKNGGGSDSSIRIFLQTGQLTVTGKKTLKDAAITGSTIKEDFAASEAEIAPQRKQLMALIADANKYKQQNDTVNQVIVSKKADSMSNILKLEVMPAVIRKYRNSPVAALQLNNFIYGYYGGLIDTAAIVPLFDQLSPDVKATFTAKSIGDHIEKVRKANRMTGTLAPAFTRQDINGKKVQLADYKGKYVLIDFWGSWCHPCRKSHPHLKELYAAYKEKGLEIIGVDHELQGDLSAMKTKWNQAVNEDKLTWVQVLNADGIKDFDIVQAYGIEAFPTKILLDKEGHIIDRIVGDDPSVLDGKLKALFEKAGS